jgi:hypothetical protein
MNDLLSKSYTVFDGHRRIASGRLDAVALAVKRAIEGGATGPVLTYDDTTGRSIDFDTRGTDDEVVARLGSPSATVVEDPATDEPRGRGRPKLGVVAREVTLLPRHWEWLNSQPGGASVTLRKLVEDARRLGADKDRIRKAREVAYHFMSAMAGDLPDFEEATRALFADDRQRFDGYVAAWPQDIRNHAVTLAFAEGNDGQRDDGQR